MIVPDTYQLTREFLAVNQQSIDRLRRLHTARPDRDLAFALEQAFAFAEHPDRGRVVMAASLLLGGRHCLADDAGSFGCRTWTAREWLLGVAASTSIIATGALLLGLFR